MMFGLVSGAYRGPRSDPAKGFRTDMTLMYLFHDALRRDVEQLARIAARTTDDPRDVLRTAVGWEMFKSYLHVHHAAEDEFLWPTMRTLLVGQPDDLLLLDAMEAEHGVLDPLLAAIEAALVDREGGPEQLGPLVDDLTTGLIGHLRHEEAEALPLIDATLSAEQFRAFGSAHPRWIGADMPRYLPWLLDGAADKDAALVLALMPEPLRIAYRDEWKSAYGRVDLWGASAER